MTLNEYVTENYENIKGWLRNVTRGEKQHLFDDLVHEVLNIFLTHPSSQDAVDTGTARYFIVRIALNQWRSGTSPFAYQYRDSFLDTDHSPEPVAEEYDVTLDILEEVVLQGLDEMYANEATRYEAIIIMMYHSQNNNYSAVGRTLNMPHTSIRKIYLRGIKKLKLIIQQHINEYRNGNIRNNTNVTELISNRDIMGGSAIQPAVSAVSQFFATKYFEIN